MRTEIYHSRYEYWLAGLLCLSGKKKIRLIETVGRAEEIYRMKPEEIRKLPGLTEREKEKLEQERNLPEEELEQMRAYCIRKDIRLILWQDSEYPARLKQIYSPPYGLYCRGNLPPESAPAVALVGARACSVYGRQIAEQAGYHLARRGVSVISGMAAGIDGAGHRGALQAGGFSCGILGCGVDVCYPEANRKVYEALSVRGGLISEYPPGTKPLARFFPQRNRMISGLSDLVLVVEAREKSGALITADFALEQGREVYAVPGRVGDALSQGTNRLIGQGAGIYLSWEDFQKEMGIFADFVEDSAGNQKFSLEKSERLVYSCLDLSPKNLDELMTETGYSLKELMENLESLREKDCILEVYRNCYIRREECK